MVTDSCHVLCNTHYEDKEDEEECECDDKDFVDDEDNCEDKIEY